MIFNPYKSWKYIEPCHFTYFEPCLDTMWLISAVKTRHRPYYTNVCYKYTHGSFNISNEIYYYFTKKLHNISFVKIIIVEPKNQNWYPKLNVPYFLNNYYVYYNTIPKSAPKGVTIVCFTLLGEKVWIFFTHNCNHWCPPSPPP